MLLLATSAALLAAWVVARFPQVNPSSGRGVTVALIGATAVLIGIPYTVPVVGVPLGAVATVFVVVLPALIYVFMTAAWLMLYVRRALDPYLR
jgi:hypothetical protein